MAFLKQLGVLTGIMLILLGCGQQTMNDKGLDTKSISDAASSGSSSSGSSGTFSVSSVDPEDGSTDVSTTKRIEFEFTKSLGSYSPSTSSSCSAQVFQLSTSSSFTTCIGWVYNSCFSNAFYSVSGDEITLCPPTLSSNTTYFLRVVASSSGGTLLKSIDGELLSTTFNSSFTTE